MEIYNRSKPINFQWILASFCLTKTKEEIFPVWGMKIYNSMEINVLWTNEDNFVRRFSRREPLTQEKLLEKFITKYETIFKWMLVGFNRKEAFWENIKRDASRGIATRSRRTMLFRSDIFKHRRSEQSYGWETFGTYEGSFAKKVLYYVRSEMLKGAVNRIEGEKWEEALIYAIASNGDFFGTGMMKFYEKMLYKNFMKTI
jgi:hypothetical protein